jgi:hypothetical protein
MTLPLNVGVCERGFSLAVCYGKIHDLTLLAVITYIDLCGKF